MQINQINNKLLKINRLTFGILSAQNIEKLRVMKVTNHLTYSEDGGVVPGGLLDHRMGVVQPGQLCHTCNSSFLECPGHFGYIELVTPLFNYIFIDQIKKTIAILCKNCRGICLPLTLQKALLLQHSINPKQYFDLYSKLELTKKLEKTCRSCKTEFETYTYNEKTNIFSGTKGPVLVEEILALFEKIKQEDNPILGFAKTIKVEALILQKLLVPSNKIRPSIFLKNLDRSEDDLTFKLAEIVRLNQKIQQYKAQKGTTTILNELKLLLDYHVITYLNNENIHFAQAKHRMGRPLNTLVQRIKGKEGRFRYDLLGKRTNFSARAVIAPSTRADFDEIELPKIVRENLSKKQYFLPSERKILFEIAQKQFEYPEHFDYKAFKIIKIENLSQKRNFFLTKENYTQILSEENLSEEGYLIERTLKEGDYVLFNRQPSLHRPSILRHKVLINKDPTRKLFKFSPLIRQVYNADFDGDEMNIHVPQSLDAELETYKLLRAKESLFTPRDGRLLFGTDQNYVFRAYQVTSNMFTFDKLDVRLLINQLRKPKYVFSHEKYEYTGKEVFSFLLPRDFNFDDKKGEDALVIVDGHLISGKVSSDHIKRTGSLLLHFVQNYSEEIWSNFLFNLIKLSDWACSTIGITLTAKDFQIPEGTKIKVNKELIKLLNTMKNLDTNAKFINTEREISTIVQKNRTDITNIIISEFQKQTNLSTMVKSKRRGSFLNFSHITAFIGQQFVRGQRISKEGQNYLLQNKNFEKKDLAAQGFINRSYIEGLNTSQMFYHRLRGREGLIDTAIRTAKAGYFQRKLVHALEDLVISEESQVIDSLGRIISFSYGPDNLNTLYWKMPKHKLGPQHQVIPGESVGVIAAQSIGEPRMQLMLRTTYTGGASEITIAGEEGLPRLTQLLETRKTTQKEAITTLYLDEKATKEEINSLLADIVKLSIRDQFNAILNNDTKIITLTIKEKIQITNEEIVSKCLKNYNVFYVDNSKIEISLPETTEPEQAIKIFNNLLKIKLSGMNSIKGAVYEKKADHYLVLLQGFTPQLFDLKSPLINFAKLNISTVKDIYQTFGVEGFREYLYTELLAVIRNQGLSIVEPHVEILTNLLAFEGERKSILRSGVIKEKEAVLSKASFEVPIKVLTLAALSNSSNVVRNNTENLLLGQKIRAGTGLYESKVSKK
jgi:DNA-directed RNA polymerase subunit A'